MYKLKKIIKSNEDYLNKAGGWESTMNNLPELASLGMLSMVEDVILTLPTVLKKERGEELTDNEKTLLEVTAKQQEHLNSSADYDRPYSYGLMDGVMQSTIFMAEMSTTGALGKGIKFGAKVAKGVSGKMIRQAAKSNIGKVIETGAQSLAIAASMPSTYANMAESYTGIIEYDKEQNKVILRQELFDKVEKETIESKKDAKSVFKKLSNKEQPLTEEENKKLEDVKARLGYESSSNLMTYDDLLDSYDPMSAGRAIQHGITVNIAEVIAERVGGKLFDKGMKKFRPVRNFTNKFDKTKFGGAYNKGFDKFKKITGTQDMIQSVPAEMFEEYFVSPMHAVNDWSTDPLTEWQNIQNHVDVAAQTVIMGLAFRGVGSAMSIKSRIKNPKLHKNRKKLQEQFKSLKNSVTDAEVSEIIDLSNSRSEGDVNLQKLKIDNLRHEGKNKEADYLEQKMFSNMTMAAFKTGTINEFEDSLDYLSTNKNLSPETIKNAQIAKQKVGKLKDASEMHQGKTNFGKLMQLEQNILDSEQTIQDADSEISNISDRVRKDVDGFIEDNFSEDIPYTLDDIFYYKPEDEDGSATYNKFLDKLADQGFDSLEALNILDSAKQSAKLNIKDAKSQINEKGGKKAQDKFKVKYKFANEFSKQYKKRKKTSFDKLEFNTKQDYLEKAHVIYKELKTSKRLRTSKGAVAKKLYKDDLDNKVFDETEIDKIVDEIDPKLKKGLTKDEIEQQVARYKSYARLSRLKEYSKKFEASQKEYGADKPKEDEEPTAEQNEINHEVDNSFEDMDNIISSKETPSEEETPDEFDELPMSTEDFSKEKREALANNIKNLTSGIEKVYGRKPTFKETIEHLMKRRGKEEIESLYDAYKLGWQDSNLKETDFDKIYDELFDPLGQAINESVDDVANLFDSPSREEVEESNEKKQDEIEKKQSRPKRYDAENVPIKKVGGRKTTDTSLKVGFSALRYKNVIVNGVMKKKTVPTNALNRSGDDIIDFFPLLDPDKFNEGEKLEIIVSQESQWKDISINIGLNKDGSPKLISFAEWVEQKETKNPDFRSTEEFNNRLPIFLTDGSGNPLAYVHDTSWYNTLNVGDPSLETSEVDPNNPTEAHQKLIEEGKKNVSDLRNEIINKGLTEVTIDTKKQGAFHELDTSQPEITIDEANPQAILAVQVGTEIQTSKGVTFNNSKRKLINKSKDFEAIRDGKIKSNGNVWNIRRIGVDPVDGKETWQAFESTRRNDTNKQNGISDQNFETLKWLWVAQARLSDRADIKSLYDEYVVNTKYDLSEENAQYIVDKVKDISGIDLTIAKNAGDFMQSYGAFRQGPALSVYGRNLFKSGTTANTLAQNTNISSFKSIKNVPLIDNEGNVSDSGKNYHDYLMTQLSTNVKSYNVGTNEDPLYATSLQPKITFSYNQQEQTQSQSQQNTPSIQDTGLLDEDTETSESDIDNTMDDALSHLSDMGLSLEDDVDELPSVITNLEALKNVSDITDGLTILQESQIVDSIFNKILDLIDNKYKGKITKNILYKELNTEFNTIFGNNKTKTQEVFDKLNTLYNQNPEKASKLKKLIDEYQILLDKFAVVENNWESLLDKSVAKATKYTEIKEVIDDDTQEEQELSIREKNYNKTSIEESPKQKSSYKLRRFMAGIREMKPDGTPKTGFMGSPLYVGFNDVYNSISQIYGTGVDIPADYNVMIGRLEEVADKQPWVKELVDKLEKANTQIKNEFVTNYAKHALTMKFAMYNTHNEGTSLKMYDTNANEITRIIRDGWKNNFKSSKLINKNKEVYSINKVYAKELLDKYNNWGDEIADVDDKELRSFLNEFGIDLSDEAWAEIKAGNFYNGRTIPYIEQFFSQAGVFNQLKSYLDHITDPSIKNTEFEENEKNHPFNDMNSILKELSKLESLFSTNAMSISFRDAGKQISGRVPPKYVTDRISRIKKEIISGDTDLVDTLRETSFSSNSLILKLLDSKPGFAKKLTLNHVGLTSLKQLGKNSNSFSNITDLNSIDHDIVKLTGLQDIKQGDLPRGAEPFNMRMGNMFLPTMSDKSQMLFLQTGVFDLMQDSVSAFEIDSNTQDVSFKQELKDMLYEQLILPEIKRIMNFHKNVKSTNIKGYDEAAKMFNLFPELNTVESEKGRRLILDLEAGDITLEDIERDFKDNLVDKLEDFFESEVNKKKVLWDSFLDKAPNGDVRNIKYFDKDYLERGKGSLNDKFTIGIYDFVINSAITNAESFYLLAGDPALYAKDTDFVDEASGDIIPPSQQPDDFFTNFSKKTGVNIGKRMALLLAPGNKMANSEDQKYKQLFLADASDISENSEYLIKLNYGEDAVTSDVRQLLQNHDDTETKETKQAIKKRLSDMFPVIKDYFNIESTDAQEYTTAKEHINVMYGFGRISDESYNNIINKIDKQKQAENNNRSLPEDSLLTKEELEFILQPMKPVYTGQIQDSQDVEKDVIRTMYIKSSSFPLLPQLTAGLQLDALRRKMEEIEENTGEGVRASYQTANKVGAVKNPINLNVEGSLDNVESSMLTLNRKDFKIQQDIPDKSDKPGVDEVSMGTQIFKLLFGNGVINDEGFELNGETLSGKKLYKKYNETFAAIIDIKRKELFSELGLDKNGQSNDKKATVDKLQKLLKSEAEKRGYPIQSIRGLDLQERIDINGNPYYEFKVPLWLATESNKYEALLNSIITNRVIKHKLPGNSYVAGSESGFNFREQDDNGKIRGVDASRIIYLNDEKGDKLYNGKALKGTNDDDNKLNKSQVFIPSKFKANGKLVDLFEKFDGNNGTYIKRNKDGTLGLKKGMIDSELLSNFSFRIPTSGHISGSTTEIAGILPPESGDLMIVPKNFTIQKGLDFDVDKETLYALHHVKNSSTGKIEVLSQKHIDELITKIQTAEENKVVELLEENSIYDIEEMEAGDTSIDEKIEKATSTLRRRLLENEFIKIHQSVFSNPKKSIQSKINQVLSMEFASNQADMIDKIISSGNTSQFSILSDEYQKEKMGLGASGKLAIGVYSNYVTFNSLAEQLDKKINLKDSDSVPKTITIGKWRNVGGVIGNQRTLDGSRFIADVFVEKQNTATDNEKEQILGRVGVNGTTINVDSLLTLLGFDKDENGNSIPYLLLSQPIIKEYVDALNNDRGITSENVDKLEEKTIADLMEKYSNRKYAYNTKDSQLIDTDSGVVTNLDDKLTGDKMLANLNPKIMDGDVQIAALAKFLELNNYAKELGKIQSLVNTKDLGKSIIEANDKFESLENFDENLLFANTTSLVGEFREKGQNEATPEGFISVGSKFIKPTTPQGHIVVNGISLSNKMWSEYFPFTDPYFKDVINEVVEVTSVNKDSANKRIELKHEVTQEIKKYIYSRMGNGLFNEKASEEREGLFIDSTDNDSLATYLSEVKSKEGKGVQSIKTNRLINKFSYELETNGSPSIIKFNNTSNDNFDEEYLYNAIPELIIENKPLPDKNGKPYNTKMLAQELVTYAYLEGGVQEAIQFIKHVPVEYLEAVTTFSKKEQRQVSVNEQLQKLNPNRRPETFKHVLGIKNIGKSNSHETHTFVKQYMQHHPEKANQYSETERKKLFIEPLMNGKELQAFILNDDKPPKFISVKNKTKSKKKQDKFSLYQNKGNGRFEKIDVLGTHGMSEYEYNNENTNTIIKNSSKPSNKHVANQSNKETSNQRITGLPFDMNENTTVRELVESISKEGSGIYKEVAEYLLPLVDDNTSVVLDSFLKSRGRYDKNTNTISLNKSAIQKSKNDAAKIFLHEFTHSITRKELDKYFEADGITLKSEQSVPPHVASLNMVFNAYRDTLDKQGLEEFVKDKKDKKTLEEDRINKYYGGTSIFEFVTMMLTEPDVQQKMKEVPYKQSGMTIWDKFKESIIKMIKAINPNASGSITDNAIGSILDFIEVESKSRLLTTEKSTVTEADKKAIKYNKEMSEPDSENNPNFDDMGEPDNNIDKNTENLLPDCI